MASSKGTCKECDICYLFEINAQNYECSPHCYKVDTIYLILKDLNFIQLAGLGSLIFLAIEEQTTLEYQWERWEYLDVPLGAIQMCELNDPALLQLASMTATYTLEKLTNYVRE
jgi:hypothetical protein